MKLKCPVCKEALNQKYICKNQHAYFMDEGVLQLMTPKFKAMLENWLVDFDIFRKPLIQKLDFNTLPKSGIKLEKNTWKARLEDTLIIDGLINNGTKTALDAGSWNGWLANHLTKKGIETTAIDCFVHELDGMKAKKFYDNSNWTSIQMDLEDLSVLDDKFDLIILNRCYPYFTDMNKIIESSLQLLSSDGKLIITGLNLSKQKGDKPELKAAKDKFKKQGKDFLFKPFKGFIENEDIEYLKQKNFEIYHYPNLKNRIKQLFRLINQNISYYAVYSHDNKPYF